MNIYKPFIIIISIFCAFQTLVAQEQTELDIICSGKWGIKTLEVSGKKIETSDKDLIDNWMVFDADGILVGKENGATYTEKWEYDSNILKISKSGKMYDYEVLSLSSNKITLFLNDVTMDMVRLDN